MVDAVSGVDERLAPYVSVVVDPELVPCGRSGDGEGDDGEAVLVGESVDVVGAVGVGLGFDEAGAGGFDEVGSGGGSGSA